MYLTRKQIEAAYKILSDIDPDTDGTAGKRSGERVSAISYFLATCAALHRNTESSLALDPNNNSDNRSQFVQDVGEVVRFNLSPLNTGPYTNNFKDELADKAGFGVGNNFLTQSLTKDGPYPGRPKNSALINKNDYTLTLNTNWQDNISKYGLFDDYSEALAVWLCRFENLGSKITNKSDFSLAICEIITKKYGVEVKNKMCRDHSKIESFVMLENGQLILNQAPTADLSNLAHPPEIKGNGEIRSYPPKLIKSDVVGENVIFYGAPGTGKSRRIVEMTKGFDKTQISRTVFHSEYQNSDFIGALKPSVDGKNITYKFVPGPFTKSFVKALVNPESPFVLIIEEINRANAAAVFGDVFQLLDRDINGRSEYWVEPEEDFKSFVKNELLKQEITINWDELLIIPNNLSILATMNSADQGVLPMDSAFKRRWKFEYLPLDFLNCAKGTIEHCSEKYSWSEFAQAVNTLLTGMNIEEDKHLGPWFLNNADLSAGKTAISGKLFVYLWDDVLRHQPREKIFDCEEKSFGRICGDYLDNLNVFSIDLIELLNESKQNLGNEDESTSTLAGK